MHASMHRWQSDSSVFSALLAIQWHQACNDANNCEWLINMKLISFRVYTLKQLHFINITNTSIRSTIIVAGCNDALYNWFVMTNLHASNVANCLRQ